MSATNDILQFCPHDSGTNLEDQVTYAADANRTDGNQPGIASSKLNNKAIRQATVVASQLAQLLVNENAMSVQDNANAPQLLSQMIAALGRFAPVITSFTAGSGTFNLTYIFIISSGSAVAGATYTDSAATTFTVGTTIAAGTVLQASGNLAPASGGGPGTLTKIGGTGDATLTYYAVRVPLTLNVRMVGGGGGGAGGGQSGAGSGGNGGNTTFGTSLLVANGGNGGAPYPIANNPVGGSASLGTGPYGIAITGSSGGGGGLSVSGTTGSAGGDGGCSPFGGSGGGGAYGANVVAAVSNTGSGGGGGSVNSNEGSDNFAGTGGAAGGYVDAVIINPLSTYVWGVGAAGTAGTAGTNGNAGGAGGSGFIQVIQKYQ